MIKSFVRKAASICGKMTSGGRAGARRCVLTAAASLWVLLPCTRVTATGDTPQDVTIREERGVYTVAARFEVPQTAAVARAVLTHYEQIPRFMPDVRTSNVVERGSGRAVHALAVDDQFARLAARQVKVVHQPVARVVVGPVTLVVHGRTPVVAFARIVP